ncbi:zf-HC2 domain-containing protein [Cohnella thermotolerans]|uniref:zf-HC2 domain-containing protein n=1 Tax=Cohnella thermotolerans TaxID=329858 RepID=UPI00047925F0|nr:zf-HC2 domain-containing protein [Cohnella thermotolerans]
MNCQEVMELMQRSLDGDLDSRETSRMMEHIRSCPDCAAMLDRLTLLSNNLAQLPRVEPRFSIVDSILPQLELIPIASSEKSSEAVSENGAEDAAEPLPPRSARPGRRSYRRLTGAIAAGIVVGLLIAVNPFSWLSHSGQDNDAMSMPETAGTSSAGSAASSSEPAQSSAEAQLFAQSDEKALKNDAPGSAEASPSPEAPAAPESKAPSFTTAKPADRGLASKDSEKKDDKGLADNRSAAQETEPPESSEPETTFDIARQTGDEAAPAATPSAIAPLSPEPEGNDKSHAFTSIAPAFVWVSPDGKYKATVEDERMKVYELKDGELVLVFQSDVHAGSTIGGVRWDDQSAILQYAWTDADGKTVRLQWDAATGQETEVADENTGP